MVLGIATDYDRIAKKLLRITEGFEKVIIGMDPACKDLNKLLVKWSEKTLRHYPKKVKRFPKGEAYWPDMSIFHQDREESDKKLRRKIQLREMKRFAEAAVFFLGKKESPESDIYKRLLDKEIPIRIIYLK